MKEPLSQAKALLSIRESCAITGVSHVTLYSEINAGRLRSLKVGRRRMLTPAAIQEWIAERENAAMVHP
ncbi:MAG: helix-turn-helix domain-containing protein [Porticoccaceae bacterium]